MHKCTLQPFHHHAWHDIAICGLLDPVDRGIRTHSMIAYAADWVLEHDGARDAHALSAACPVFLEMQRLAGWPAFLVDLLPQSYGQ